MARRWPRPWQSTRGLTASVSVVTGEQRKKIGTSQASKWQSVAWDMYENVGEVWHSARYKGNGLGRCRFFVGYRETPEDRLQPIDMEKATGQEKELSGALDRVRGRDGTFASLARAYGIQQFVCGESNLVASEGREGELWEMLSPQEIKALANGGYGRVSVNVEGDENDKLDPMAPGAFVLRMWQRHPRIRSMPDSPLRAVLDVCDGIRMAQAAMTAADRNRLVLNGLFLLPSQAELPPVEGSEESGKRRLQLLDDLFEAALEIMDNPGSAASALPVFQEMDGEWIDKVKHLTFDQTTDQKMAERIAFLIRRYAQGIDLPIEIVTGLAGVNHWTAWSVTQESNVAYIGPVAAQFCEDLTAGLLVPTMEELQIGHAEQWRYAVGADMSDLTVNPNRFADTIQMYEHIGLISGEYMRDVAGVPESAKPDEDENEQRIKIAQGGWPGGVLGGDDAEVEAPGDGVSGEPGPPEESEDGPQERESKPAEDTAASIRAMTTIGRCVGAADMAIDRAMERAGARIRTKANRTRPDLTAVIDTLENRRVAAALSPATVATLGLDEEVMLEGAWESLAPRLGQWIGKPSATSVLRCLDLLARKKLWAPETDIVAPITEATSKAVRALR